MVHSQNMRLVLKNTSGETVTLIIDSEETFQDLKVRVKEEVGITLDLQDLTIKGKTISDEQKVVDYFSNQETQAEEVEQEDIKCSVPGCFSTKLTCPNKAFFNFPSEEVRCHQWALYCQRLSDQSGKHRISFNVSSAICADHFRKDQFVKNTTTLLKRTAVPCVKPELPISSSEVNPARRKSSLGSSSVSLKSERIFDDVFLNNLSNPVSDSGVLCRLCATISTDVIFIFDEMGNKLCIPEKINSYLPIVVRNTDPLPKQICHSCYEKLTAVHDMVEICIKAETKLKDLMKIKHFRSHEVTPLDPENLNDTSSINEENNTEQNENSSNSNYLIHEISNPKTPCYCCPLCSSGKMVTKSGIYKAGSIHPCHSIKEQNNSESMEQGEESDNSGQEVFSVEDVIEAVSDSKNLWTGQEFSLKMPDLEMENLYPDCIVGMDLDTIQEEPWENETTIKTEDNPVGAKTDISCRVCRMEFTSINAVLEHSFEHADTDCFQCSFCDCFFPARADLENHFQDHKIMKKKIVTSDVPNQIYQCKTCNMSFKSAIKYQMHACNNAVSGSNRCFQCNKSFRSEARLKFHQRFHEGAKPGYCEICQKTFPDEVKLYKHTIYLHSQNKGHCCEECGKVFRSVSSLRYHQRSHQGEDVMKPYGCDQCGKCFIRKSMLRNHMLATHKNLSQEGTCFTCKICFEAFPTTDYAVAHMDIQHMSECSGETTYSFEMHTVSRLYICEYCERCFTDPMQLNTHRDQHSPDMPYQCKLCGMSFPSYGQADKHSPLHYDIGDRSSQDYSHDFTIPTVYMCEYCERCFLNYVKLSEHLTVHYGDKPYHCRFCDFHFRTFKEVSDHRSTHDQYIAPIDDFDYYRPYECHYCRKAFAIEDALVKHIRMHTGEKPFICDQCGKGFSQSSGLYTHQKVHSDERPYSCSFCPRTFKIKGDRDVHVRKHSGDRPYTCDFCGKSFMTQHVYSQHRKIHTGERPYKCDVCGIAFRRSHVLTVHKRIHTGEKPNICDICGKRYRQKGDMLKHRRIQHGIVKVKVQKVEFENFCKKGC